MELTRRAVLGSGSLGVLSAVAGCLGEDSTTAVVEVDFPDCWSGHYGSDRSDGDQIVMNLEADGRRQESNFGEFDGDTWRLEMPEQAPADVEIEPPITATATIRAHTRCAGGSAREWPDQPLALRLEVDGEVVAEDTAGEAGEEARVESESG